MKIIGKFLTGAFCDSFIPAKAYSQNHEQKCQPVTRLCLALSRLHPRFKLRTGNFEL